MWKHAFSGRLWIRDRNEHGSGFKSGGFSAFSWIWIGFGFYKFCLTGIGLDLIIFFWTSSQLSVLCQNCRLLHLICTFASVAFLTSVQIVQRVCLWITYYPVMQGRSLLLCVSCHQRGNCVGFIDCASFLDPWIFSCFIYV